MPVRPLPMPEDPDRVAVEDTGHPAPQTPAPTPANCSDASPAATPAGSGRTRRVRASGEADPAQRHTLRTLVASQMLGGVGLSSGIAVASILAEQILGSPDLAGLASTAQVLGAAVLSVPAARLMAARGRRVGLVAGYITGTVGAVLAVAAGIAGSFVLLLVATALFGASTTANNQARYAATDLATPQRRGRSLAIVVWATTVGAVLGPNLVGPAGSLAEALGMDALLGPFLFSMVGFLAAAAWLTMQLRPDPLLLARQRSVSAGGSQVSHGSLGRALRVLRTTPAAMLGLVALAIGHTVMVAVMVMTPLHMHHGGAELRLIGLVISAHVLGMFAFAPVMGWLVDRYAGTRVIVLGAAVLVVASLIAAQAPQGWSGGLVLGLFLLGLGWSAAVVAGSTVLTGAVPLDERPGVQGASDLVMGLSAAGGGALSGIVVGTVGYEWLCLGAAVLAAILGLGAAISARFELSNATRVESG